MTLTADTARPSEKAGSDSQPLLELNNVEVVFNDVILVLRGMSLQARRGEITALLGANGAGKSTTLKAIAGLLKTEDGEITRGTVTYEGADVTRTSPDKKVRDGIFLVMEGRGIVQDMTIRDNLRLGAFSRPSADIEAEIAEVYRFFPRLKERQGLAGYLSGGEQQMLAIARSLMSRPSLLMLDEPSLGLAPRIVRQIFRLIRDLRDRDLTILLVEQNAHEVLRFADRAYVLSTGECRYAGPASRLHDKDALMQAYIGELVA